MSIIIEIGEFTFDPDLVKGWRMETQTFNAATLDEPMTVQRLVVYYDCFEIAFVDEDHALQEWLKSNLKGRERGSFSKASGKSVSIFDK